METVKIKDKKNGAVIKVKKSIAGDFVGTGNFEIVEDTKPFAKKPFENKPFANHKINSNKEEKIND